MDNKDFMSQEQPRNHLVFYVNGRKHDIKDVQPESTLLQYLRGSSVGLTGTKLGCGEGGCGACTVMISSYDFGNKAIRHLAVNACLAPLCSVDWCHVTTVEGIGSMRRGLHPVQKRIAEMHGSQCGFCTPGIVMALYALLRSNPSASAEDIEAGLDGNLCRCTGYRPILDAAKSLGKNGGARSGCCRGNSDACPCLELEASINKASTNKASINKASINKASINKASINKVATERTSPATSDEETSLISVDGAEDGLSARVGARRRECTVSRGRDPRYTERYSDKCEPIFPPSLALRAPGPVTITGRNVTWHYPTSLQELMRLKAAHPEARIVAGNTEVGIEVKFKNMRYPVLISPTRVPELGKISETTAEGIPLEQNGVFIGGAVPLSSVEHYLDEKDKYVQGGRGSGALGGAARACVDMLRWFASTQIRNVACLAGNLATASPISDMNPLLGACGAQVLLESIRAGRRRVNVRDFFVK